MNPAALLSVLNHAAEDGAGEASLDRIVCWVLGPGGFGSSWPGLRWGGRQAGPLEEAVTKLEPFKSTAGRGAGPVRAEPAWAGQGGGAEGTEGSTGRQRDWQAPTREALSTVKEAGRDPQAREL